MTRPPDGTALAAYQAARAADQRLCVSRSVEESSLERETQTRRSGGCGKVLLMEDTQRPGSAIAGRPPCGRKNCTDCGPAKQAQMLRHFLALMDGHHMRRRRIEPAARRATLARLRRGGHQWVPIPAPDGALVLWATGGVGELVTDVEPALAADLAAAPIGRNITPCRGWSVKPVACRGAGRFRLLGHAKVPMAKVIKAALDAELYRRELPLEALPAAWAEAHELERPADELEWRRFTHRIGLHWPEPRQHRRRAAA